MATGHCLLAHCRAATRARATAQTKAAPPRCFVKTTATASASMSMALLAFNPEHFPFLVSLACSRLAAAYNNQA